MKTPNHPAVLFSLFALAVLAGCKPSLSIPEPGHYEGTLIHEDGGRLASFFVSAEVSSMDHGAGSIKLTGTASVFRMELKLTAIQPDSLTLDLPVDPPGATALTRDGACYWASTPLKTRLCSTNQSLTLDVTSPGGEILYSLSLDHRPATPHAILEAPRSFTLDQAVKQALALEFNARIEFQQLMQARHQATQAYLNLLPHLSANSILAAMTATDFVGLLGSVGDLVPFLLPSRWFEAKEAGDLAQAESFGMQVMRADAGVQVEGLAYAYSRDRKIAGLYEEAHAQVEQIRKQLQEGEIAGRYPAGTADMVGTIQLQMEDDAGQLDLNFGEQKVFLAQALGLINPDGVTDLAVPEPRTPIEAAPPLDDKALQAAVLGRSYELLQMAALLRAARTQNDGGLFTWMDPAGDPALGLGFGLGEAVAIQASKIDELLVAREQLQALLLQKLSAAVAEYNDALDGHKNAKLRFALLEQRLKRELDALEANAPANVLDLVLVLPNHLKAQISIRNAEAVYRLTRAKLDRLLLEGYYTQTEGTP